MPALQALADATIATLRREPLRPPLHYPGWQGHTAKSIYRQHRLVTETIQEAIGEAEQVGIDDLVLRA